MSKINKKKVVTFQLVSRSVEDPNNADPNASEHVLVPIHIGEDVDPELVEQLQRQMTPEARAQDKKRNKQKKSDGRKGIGARYNKIFGEDLPDDGEDYSKYFKAIDEENDDAVFVAPDGSVHDLRKKEVADVDLLVNKMGLTPDMFGTEADKSLPKLVDDSQDLLASGIDPDVLLAMDDENAIPLDDDFISKALDAEAEEDEDDDYDEDSFDDYDEDGNKVKKTMSRVSATPTHLSHISHRSHAMDMQEERVDYIIENVFREEESGSEDEHMDDQKPTNWAEIAEDLKQFEGKIELNPVPPPPPDARPVVVQHEEAEEEEDHEEEEEDIFKPKPIPLDIRSVTDLASTTSNLPSKVIETKKKRKAKKQEEEEKLELPEAPEFAPKPGETKEEAKARKKAIKEYQRQKRALKKERKQKFAQATKKVHKSIAASGASRGARVYNLD